MTDVSELIERVKGAMGPNRRIDRELSVLPGGPNWRHSKGGRVSYFRRADKGEDGRTWSFAAGPDDDDFGVDLNDNAWPYYTASVGAALALVERVRPRWVCDTLGQDATGTLGDMRGIGWTAEFSNALQSCQGQAPTLPLAILHALLLSLQSEADK